MRRLCVRVYLQVEAALHVKQNVVPATEYHTPYDEALHHLHFCEAKVDAFRGQADVLDKIKTALVVRVYQRRAV